jgi:hypothetical protein
LLVLGWFGLIDSRFAFALRVLLQLILCCLALASLLFGCWFAIGSRAVRCWPRSGSRLVRDWFPAGSLLLSCWLTLISLRSARVFAAGSLLRCLRGRSGAGSQLAGNLLGPGSRCVQVPFRVGAGLVHGWSLVGSRLARGRFPAGSHHFRGCEAGVTRLVLDCYAKDSLTAVEALARGGFSDGSGGWFRAGSRLVQGWLPVGYRLVRGWLPVAFLLRHSNFACFCCDCVSADSALLCVGCKGGRVLVRNCFESGSGRVQRRAGSRLLRDWFPVGFLLLSGCPCWLTPTSLALCERFRRRFFVASPWLHGRSGAVFATGSTVTRDWLRAGSRSV